MIPSHPYIFPMSMLPAVADYKKLAADYPEITDPTLKSAYKAVLDKKIADLQATLAAYASTASSEIASLAVD